MAEKVVIIGKYDGMTTNKDGISVLKFKFPFSEIVNYINTIKLIGLNIKLIAKTDQIKFKVGTARFKMLKLDREGEAQLQLEGEDFNYHDLQKVVDEQVTVCMLEETADE